MKTKRAKGMGKGCEEHQENKFCLKMTKQKKTKQMMKTRSAQNVTGT